MSRVKPALLTRMVPGLAQIGRAHRHACAEFGRERIQRRLAGAGERDGRALGVDGAGDGAADAAGGAGDEGGFATQIKHGRFLGLMYS
jgi:hypothetical protein